MQDIAKDWGNKPRINPPSETHGISSFSSVSPIRYFILNYFLLWTISTLKSEKQIPMYPLHRDNECQCCQTCYKFFYA